MISSQTLWEQLGRRPFQPFRVTLVGGEAVEIVRRNQAVVAGKNFVVGTPQDRFRWIQLQQIDRIDLFELRQPASG